MSQIRREEASDRLIIGISGRFTFALYKEFAAAYKNLPSNPVRIEIDLAEVEYLDSSALGMLLSMRNHIEEHIPITLSRSSPDVRKILEIARFDQRFIIE